MNRHTNHTEVVRLSVGNWLAIVLFVGGAVLAIVAEAWRLTHDVESRLSRVETRVEQIWDLLRPRDDVARK